MILLYLARHGETIENSTGILQGHLPGNLSQQGIEQAHTLGRMLSTTEFSQIICSDLQRTKDTAALILQHHSQIPIDYCPLLRERDWGSLTGKEIATVRGMEFPTDVESVEQMFKRAAAFIDYLFEKYNNQTVLSVGHGLFNRVILAYLNGVSIQDIPPMKNAEVRIIELTSAHQIISVNTLQDTEADN